MPELQGQLRPSRGDRDGSPGLRLKPPARQKAEERRTENGNPILWRYGVNCPMVKPPGGGQPYHTGGPRIRHHRHHPAALRWCMSPNSGTC
ncbi:hypothetical protein Bca52824_077275 [Brassica carinata]|uniref:Uncharacterized protein n=1 Tax=Brassica carinata TaxID=52824 RepID=A0A8X7PTR6_BRACI|nr:hypothetical protein Bca52824_077275 [Brassica carinata]